MSENFKKSPMTDEMCKKHDNFYFDAAKALTEIAKKQFTPAELRDPYFGYLTMVALLRLAGEVALNIGYTSSQFGDTAESTMIYEAESILIEEEMKKGLSEKEAIKAVSLKIEQNVAAINSLMNKDTKKNSDLN